MIVKSRTAVRHLTSHPGLPAQDHHDECIPGLSKARLHFISHTFRQVFRYAAKLSCGSWALGPSAWYGVAIPSEGKINGSSVTSSAIHPVSSHFAVRCGEEGCKSSSLCQHLPGKVVLQRRRDTPSRVRILEHVAHLPIVRLDVRGLAEGKVEMTRHELLAALLDSALEADVARTALQRSPQKLVRRFLPPGKYTDLYQLYVSHQIAHAAPVASSSTFFRTLDESGWRRVLKFRPKSQHAMCHTCHELKSQVRHARGVQEHAEATDKLYRHLAGQFADRQCYWEMRSRSARDRDVICLIADGMDKSKFLVPRYHCGRTPKNLETIVRPSCELYAVLVHGHCICTWVTDCDQSAGSDWAIETIARSLNLAFKLAQQKGRPWPQHLKIFADNTPKECKNSWFANWLGALTSSGYFQTIAQEHLTVGHTHEDIGPCLSPFVLHPFVPLLLRCLFWSFDQIYPGRG